MLFSFISKFLKQFIIYFIYSPFYYDALQFALLSRFRDIDLLVNTFWNHEKHNCWIGIYTKPSFNRSFKRALNDVILSRRAIRNMNTLYPDATPEELRAVDNVCIICREEMLTGTGIQIVFVSFLFFLISLFFFLLLIPLFYFP